VTLTVKTVGKASRTLTAAGSVKVVAKLTYSPSGGDPRARTVDLTLKLTP
jgi:hypothetical protein